MQKKVIKKTDYSKQGKKNRASGVRFEAKVRADLESMGWIVDKWTNTVDYENTSGGSIPKIVPAKRKYNPFKKVMVIGTGFPDFICFKKAKQNFEIVGIEVKKNGYLNQVEKGMCHWLLESKIFSKILIAKAVKEGRAIKVKYVDFQKKYVNKG